MQRLGSTNALSWYAGTTDTAASERLGLCAVQLLVDTLRRQLDPLSCRNPALQVVQ